MKQIKGILLFLMSIVLVAFGSQNSRSSKNLVKQLEDETKKVGNKMKESELQAKKEEQKKQAVQPKQTVAANPAQQPPPVQNVTTDFHLGHIVAVLRRSPAPVASSSPSSHRRADKALPRHSAGS